MLALTFTNKAAGEMRSRVEALAPAGGGLGRDLPQPLRPAAPIVRPAGRHGSAFTIYDQADRLRAVKPAMERLDLDGLSITPERIDAAISRAKNDLVGPEELAERGGDHVSAIAAQVYAAYQKRLRDSSAVDFDDLLVHLVTILKEHETSAPSSTPDSATSWSTSIRTPTWPSTRSSGGSRPTTPTSASPATPTSRSTVGAGRISTTSSTSRATSPAAGSSSSSATIGARRTSCASPTT